MVQYTGLEVLQYTGLEMQHAYFSLDVATAHPAGHKSVNGVSEVGIMPSQREYQL